MPITAVANQVSVTDDAQADEQEDHQQADDSGVRVDAVDESGSSGDLNVQLIVDIFATLGVWVVIFLTWGALRTAIKSNQLAHKTLTATIRP